MALTDTTTEIQNARTNADTAQQQVTQYKASLPSSSSQQALRTAQGQNALAQQLQRVKISQANEQADLASKQIQDYKGQLQDYEKSFNDYLSSDSGKLQYAKESGVQGVPVYDRIVKGGSIELVGYKYNTPSGPVTDYSLRNQLQQSQAKLDIQEFKSNLPSGSTIDYSTNTVTSPTSYAPNSSVPSMDYKSVANQATSSAPVITANSLANMNTNKQVSQAVSNLKSNFPVTGMATIPLVSTQSDLIPKAPVQQISTQRFNEIFKTNLPTNTQVDKLSQLPSSNIPLSSYKVINSNGNTFSNVVSGMGIRDTSQQQSGSGISSWLSRTFGSSSDFGKGYKTTQEIYNPQLGMFASASPTGPSTTAIFRSPTIQEAKDIADGNKAGSFSNIISGLNYNTPAKQVPIYRAETGIYNPTTKSFDTGSFINVPAQSGNYLTDITRPILGAGQTVTGTAMNYFGQFSSAQAPESFFKSSGIISDNPVYRELALLNPVNEYKLNQYNQDIQTNTPKYNKLIDTLNKATQDFSSGKITQEQYQAIQDNVQNNPIYERFSKYGPTTSLQGSLSQSSVNPVLKGIVSGGTALAGVVPYITTPELRYLAGAEQVFSGLGTASNPDLTPFQRGLGVAQAGLGATIAGADALEGMFKSVSKPLLYTSGGLIGGSLVATPIVSGALTGNLATGIGQGLGTGVGLGAGLLAYPFEMKYKTVERPRTSDIMDSSLTNVKMSPNSLRVVSPGKDTLATGFKGEAKSVQTSAGTPIVIGSTPFRDLLGLGPKFVSEPNAVVRLNNQVTKDNFFKGTRDFTQTREQYQKGYNKALKDIQSGKFDGKEYSSNQAKGILRNTRPEVLVSQSSFGGRVEQTNDNPLVINLQGKRFEYNLPGMESAKIKGGNVFYPFKTGKSALTDIGNKAQETFVNAPSGKEIGSLGEVTGYKGKGEEYNPLGQIGKKSTQSKDISMIAKTGQLSDEVSGLDISKYNARTASIDITSPKSDVARSKNRVSNSEGNVFLTTPKQKSITTANYLTGEKTTEQFIGDNSFSVSGEKLPVKLSPIKEQRSSLTKDELSQERKDLEAFYGKPKVREGSNVLQSIYGNEKVKSQVAKSSYDIAKPSRTLNQPSVSPALKSSSSSAYSFGATGFYNTLFRTKGYSDENLGPLGITGKTIVNTRTVGPSVINLPMSKSLVSDSLSVSTSSGLDNALSTANINRLDTSLSPKLGESLVQQPQEKLQEEQQNKLDQALTLQQKQETKQSQAPVYLETPKQREKQRPSEPRKPFNFGLPNSQDNQKRIVRKQVNSKRPTGSFDVYTKVNRKEVLIASGVSESAGLDIGTSATLFGTKSGVKATSASIILRPSNAPAKNVSTRGEFQRYKDTFRPGLRQAKGSSLTLVQKQGKRISNPFEVKAIQSARKNNRRFKI